MRIRSSRVLGIGLAFATLPTFVLAQSGVGVAVGVLGGASAGEAQAGLPYTAQFKTTTVRKLANGTTITHSSTSLVARDSEGRVRHEQSLSFGEVTPERKFISISDPVAHTWLNWSTGGPKVAQLDHLLAEDEIRSRLQAIKTQRASGNGAISGTTTASSNTGTVQIARGIPLHRGMKQESLGSKTINGVVVDGERITTTIPVGKIGNDQPLTTTREFWRSPDLGLTVLEMTDDPQNGTTTTELTTLDRNEPDPSLFRAPEGYTVKENEPQLK